MKKSEKVNRDLRKLLKKSLWVAPSVFVVLDLLSVRAQAQTSIAPGLCFIACAPPVIRRRVGKKRNKPKSRLRPLDRGFPDKKVFERKSPFKTRIFDR